MKWKKDVPSVILTGNHVDYAIASWLHIDEEECREYMELILSNLGFDSSCKIDVYKCYKNQYGEQYLGFLVNDDSMCRMCISNLMEDGYPIIRMDRNSNGCEFSYQVVVDGLEGISLNMCKRSELVDNKIYTYELSKEWIEYTITDFEYTLEFRVAKPIRFISNFGGYKRYDVNNQDKLFNYFISLDFKQSIFDIYKKICEISIGNDVSKYSFIDLRLKKCVYDDEVLEDKVTDLIYLEDGELISLIVTNDNKQVWYDKNDISIDYVYDTDLMQVRFSMCDIDGASEVRTKLRCKNDCLVDRDNCKNIESAKREVVKVKKLVQNINLGGKRTN